MEEENKKETKDSSKLIPFLGLFFIMIALLGLWLFPQNKKPQDLGNGSSNYQESIDEEALSESLSIAMEEARDESIRQLEAAYEYLEAPSVYSSNQFALQEVEDPKLKNAFVQVKDRLIQDQKYYSAAEYILTVYPTIDENIFNLNVSQRFHDKNLDLGNYQYNETDKSLKRI